MITKASRYRAPVAWRREVLASFRVNLAGRSNVIRLRTGIAEATFATVTVELTVPMNIDGAERDLEELTTAITSAIRRAGR